MAASQPLPGESAKAFAAFCAYRDQGATRSLTAVGRSLAKSTTLLARWSSHWSWVERVTAWDAETALKVAAAQQADLVEMADRHGRMGRALQGKAIAALVTVDPSTLRPEQLVRMFEAGVKAERDSRGVGRVSPGPSVTSEPAHPLDELSVEERFARVELWKRRLEASPA